MSFNKSYSRVQSFPSPQLGLSFAPTLIKLAHLHKTRISIELLSNILDASIEAQKMGMTLLSNSPTMFSKSALKFINHYVESTVLLLDACASIHLRLETIRGCLNSIPIGLHFLEGDHEPSIVVLRRVAAALEFSRFKDKQQCCKMEKDMLKIRACYNDIQKSSLLEHRMALNGSWAMAILAIEAIGSAMSIKSQTSPRNREKGKKTGEMDSMEELAMADLAVRTLNKLISTSQKNGGSRLWRVSVKAAAMELRMKKERLEKALPLIKDRVGVLCKLIMGLRISMLGLLSTARKEVVLKLVNPSGGVTDQMDIDSAQFQGRVSWVQVKTKMDRKCCSLSRIGPNALVSFRSRLSNKALKTCKLQNWGS